MTDTAKSTGNTCYLTCLFTVIGFYIVVTRLWRLVECLFKSFSPCSSMKVYAPIHRGSWAVITGGSGGIGRQYVEEMAKAGLNVFVLDRDADGLAKLQREFTGAHSELRILTQAIDFAKADDTAWQMIRKKVMDLGDVAVLVNNVGLTVDPPGKLHEVPLERVSAILAVNITTLTIFTHFVVGMMVERKGRKGLVINMSSFTAKVPVPMLAVYSASKRYVDHLNGALAAEYKDKIDFVSAAPWWVATDMTHIKKANWRVISAQSFVAGVMKYLGTSHTSIDPYPLHTLLDLVVEALPKKLMDMGNMMFMNKVRASYLRRAQRQQQQQFVVEKNE